jgi:hypothetical protein
VPGARPPDFVKSQDRVGVLADWARVVSAKALLREL